VQASTLVIGGGGFIGSHLVPALIAAGRRVTTVGRSKQPHHRLPAGVDYVSADFGSRELMEDLLGRHQEVIHLAYATVPNTSFDNPLSDLEQNLSPAVRLFEAVAAAGVRMVLVSSGGTVYGEAVSTPVNEDHPTNPISPYGVTKLTLEKYAHLYAVTHGLKVICVRPGNAYGPGQHPHTGQGFVSTAMASAMAGQAVRIFGEQGTIRDYIHVSDVAAGILAALEHGQLSAIYNIGSGRGLSNRQVLDAMVPVLREVGCELRIERQPERVFDVRVNVLDSTRLSSVAGWRPKIDLHEGLEMTRDWLRLLPGVGGSD